MPPKVSVVILNWNGKEYLANCLASLAKASYATFEVIVVDNNSSDGSVEFVRKNFPRVKVIASNINLGFASGNNLGFRKATGKYVVFLNNDTVVTEDFLAPLVSDLEKDEFLGCVEPQLRMLSEPRLIDQVGSFLTSTGYLYHYGFHKPFNKAIYQNRREIFSAKGACMMLPRKVLQKVGVFDDDFFIFFEETDLCYRLWLAGYSVLYEPKSIIYHRTGGDTSDTYAYERRVYLSTKNMLCCYLKNFGLLNLLTIFPILILMQGLVAINFLVRGKPSLTSAVIRG